MWQRVLFVMCVWVSSVTAQDAEPFRSYHIGNSLTWDLQPLGLAALSTQRRLTHEVGYHIRCGMPLAFIWANPDDTCVEPVAEFGTFGPALAKHRWDVVTLQPHRVASTLGDDERVILGMIGLAKQHPGNQKTRFLIHAAWPGDHGKDYAKQWTQPIMDADGATTVLCREYFAHLLKRVRSKTDASVDMIPAGEVLYQLDRKLQAGALPGTQSVAEFYRDEVHLSHDRGRFAVALAAWAGIFQADPTGLKRPGKHYGNDEVFSPDYYKLVYETVGKVLAESAQSK